MKNYHINTNHINTPIFKNKFLCKPIAEITFHLNKTIHIIRSFFLEENCDLTQKQFNRLLAIFNTSHQLSLLIENIIVFSKVKKNQISLYKTSVNINKLLHSVINKYEESLSNKKTSISTNLINSIPLIYADEEKLNLLFNNLLDYIVRYAHTDSIKLSTSRINGMLEISICYLGTCEEFEKFKSTFTSSNINLNLLNEKLDEMLLYVSKYILELHSANLNITLKNATQIVVKIAIPIYQLILNSDLEQKNINFNSLDYALDVKETINILIVSKTPEDTNDLKNVLLEANYSLTIVNAGKNLLELLEKECNFHLIILDDDLSDICEFELCKKIRQKYSLIELPILMITTKNERTDILSGFDSGLNDYLTKPFNNEILLARVKTLITLKSAINNAIISTKVLESEQKQRILAEKLHRFTDMLTSTLDLKEVFSRLLESLVHIIHFDSGITLLKKHTNYYISSCYGYDNKEQLLNLNIPTNDPIFSEIFNTDTFMIINNIENNEKFKNIVLKGSTKSWLIIPLIYKNEKLGILILHSKKPNFYTQYDAEIVLTFTTEAGIAIENARLFGELKKLATLDSLTNLYNRGHILSIAEKEFDNAKKHNTPLAVIMFDIDYFKNVNDTYGHGIGDKVLQSVASIGLQTIKRNGSLGRYGGEEFIVIIPNNANVKELAENLRILVSNSSVHTENLGDVKVTISLGISHLKDSVESLGDLLKLADYAMYKAKNSGRNKVIELE